MTLNAANYCKIFNNKCQTQSLASYTSLCQVLIVEYEPEKWFAIGYDPGPFVYPLHSIVFK